jgi:hypothetical protein
MVGYSVGSELRRMVWAEERVVMTYRIARAGPSDVPRLWPNCSCGIMWYVRNGCVSWPGLVLMVS